MSAQAAGVATQASADAPYPAPAPGAPLVVFDFDHTLYDGDSGSHLYTWLIRRSPWRMLLALLLAPIAGPMIAFLPTRRHGVGLFVWIGTLGTRSGFDALARAYVRANVEGIRARLLPHAIAVLHGHRVAGDRVVVATGAPPHLARSILAFAAHEDLPVVGSEVERWLGGFRAGRHCHHAMKMTMLREAGFDGVVAAAYSDSTADLPLLQAARRPVVVNPTPKGIAFFRRRLPAGTPMLNWGCPGRAGETPAGDR